MKKILKKTKQNSGFTLIEMIVATAVLAILGGMLGTGMVVAQKNYVNIVSQSEMELLSSNISNLLYNELRYSRDVITKEDGTLERYTSESYGRNTDISVSNGQILANDKRMLSTGVYGYNGAYKIDKLDIKYSDGIFSVDLKIVDNLKKEVENKFTVRSMTESVKLEEES